MIGKTLFYLFSHFAFETPLPFINTRNRQTHQIKDLEWEDQTNLIRLQEKREII